MGLVLAATLVAPSAATAQIPGLPPLPILGDPPPSDLPQSTGAPATPHPVSAPPVPQHPFMAPNGLSNIHDDAYQTDTYAWAGPLGSDVQVSSTLFARECGSVTVDSQGRLETICVGLDHPVLALLDPVTLNVLATYDLPLRNISANPFRDFTGGGYFYLDNHDRAVTPTPSRHIYVVAQTGGPGFELVADYDLSSAVPSGDGIISALPDWDGPALVRIRKGRGRMGRPGQRPDPLAQPRRGDHELVRGRRRRRGLHRHRPGAVPLRRAQRRNRADVAGRLRQRRRHQAGPVGCGLGDDADDHGPQLRRDNRQRRPDAGRRRPSPSRDPLAGQSPPQAAPAAPARGLPPGRLREGVGVHGPVPDRRRALDRRREQLRLHRARSRS